VAEPFNLLSLKTQAIEVLEQTQDLCEELSEEAFNWRPPFGWSVGQCLVHLNLTMGEMVKGLEDSLPTLQAAGQGIPQYPAWERFLLGLEEPPPRIRIPTLKRLAPPQQHSKTQVLLEFVELRHHLTGLGEHSQGLDWGRNKIPFPLWPVLRVSWGSALAFALAHDRRHLYQAGGVLAHPEFPIKG
jgi:hypothetical protein